MASTDWFRAAILRGRSLFATAFPSRHRAPLALQAIMTLPQPTAFSALIHGHDGECRRPPFADAG
jgi:hypothetical protein